MASLTEGQMKTFQDLIERMATALRGRYVHALEEESARLRAENRALLNSLLGTAGIAPLESARPPGPAIVVANRAVDGIKRGGEEKFSSSIILRNRVAPASCRLFHFNFVQNTAGKMPALRIQFPKMAIDPHLEGGAWQLTTNSTRQIFPAR
jgi:hypothetical protein